MIDAEEAGYEIINGNHDGYDKDRCFQAFQAGAHEDDQVELEA